MALALTGFVVLRGRARPRAALATMFAPAHLAVGAVFGLSSVCWVLAIVTTSVANTLFLTASAPLFAALLAWAFLRERVPPRTILAIVVAIAGMALIVADGLGRGAMAGNAFALLTALSWAAMVTVLRAARIDNPAPGLAVGAILVALTGLFMAPTLAVTPSDLIWLALLGLVILPVSFFLIGLGPVYIPTPEVSLIMLLEAVLGPLWAWLAIGQTPNAATMTGGAVILATLAVHFAIGLRREAGGRG